MIDLRYHVYSLAAVFFALAIGIVVGSSFVGKPADRKELLAIRDHYEQTFATMRTEMHKQQDSLRMARSEFARSERMCAALMPAALKDKLLYHNVAIIQTGDYDDLASELSAVLRSAGARVTSITKIPSSFDFKDAQVVSDAAAAVGIVPKPGETERTAILRTIGELVVNARHTEKLSALEEKGVINRFGSGDYMRWNRDVVIIGGASGKDSRRAELVDAPLIDSLVGLGATVVGCECAKAASSYVSTWKRANIATVDNADTLCGQVAFVCALAGETASFGQKPTADRLVPETLREDGGGR